MSTRPHIAVAVVLDGDRVLVGRRSDSATDAPGLHEFPGGKVEPGEPPESAAVRECLEEAGLDVRILERLEAVRSDSRTGPIDVLFFVAEPIGRHGAPKRPFEWRRVATLDPCLFPKANAGVLAWLQLRQGGS